MDTKDSRHATLAAIAVVALLVVLGVILGLAPEPAVPGTSIPPPVSITYAVNFVQHGLPGGIVWGVMVDGLELNSSTALDAFGVNEGTHAFNVVPVAGYTSTPSAGTFAIYGSGRTIQIEFSSPQVPTYPANLNITYGYDGGSGRATFEGVFYLNFTNGLDLSSLNGTSIQLSMPNGSYSYSLGSSDKHWAPDRYGGVLVIAGQSAWLSVNLAPFYYTWVVAESGLSGGWTYNFTGTGNAGTFEAFIPAGNQSAQSAWNGTYSFTIGDVAGYRASPAEGTVEVDGANITNLVQFTPDGVPLYDVDFIETGLPVGVNWSVTILGTSEWSHGGNLTQFTDPNGSYMFLVSSVPGYSPSEASGEVEIHGEDVVQSVSYVQDA
ncbi:MAG: hypothetical protein ACLPZM_07450 [Thermoplasmata archaeon]